MSDFEFDFLIMQMKCKTKPATALNFMPFKWLLGKLATAKTVVNTVDNYYCKK